MNKILNGKIIKRYTKKFRRFKGFKNEHIKFECNITIIFKFIFVFILIISVYNIFTNNFILKYFFNSNNNININTKENYDWIQNAKEIINKQLSIFKGKNLLNDNNRAKKYFSFRQYNKKENSKYNIEITENLKKN